MGPLCPFDSYNKLTLSYLEEKGFRFEDSSAKYLPDGRMLVIYSEQEIGGFAIHLMQK